MDGFAEQLGPEFEEKYRTLVGQVEEKCRKIGLYLTGAQVATDGSRMGRLVVVATFDIGDLAWTNRVVNPEQAKVDDTVREMEDVMTEAQIEAMRQEYLRRKGKADGA